LDADALAIAGVGFGGLSANTGEESAMAAAIRATLLDMVISPLLYGTARQSNAFGFSADRIIAATFSPYSSCGG
jgi:hypothetical protein